MLDQVNRMHADPVIGTAVAAQARLLHSAAEDPRGAWKAYERTIAAATAIGAELDRERIELETALAERRDDDAIAIAEAAIPRADDAGLMLMVSLFYEARGKALMRRTAGDRAENLEAAIVSYEEAGRRAPEAGHRAEVHMHLGLAHRERVRGDRGENIKQAIFFLRDALSLLDDSSSPEMRALVQTNLASALLIGDRGDRTTDLHEAERLCHEALQFRSIERNAVDWGYSQLNLAAILQNLAHLGARDLRAAKAVYQEVIDNADSIPEDWMAGAAHCGLGRLLRICTDHTEEERVEIIESPELVEPQEREDQILLEAAREHFDKGLPLAEDDWLPARQGQALADYAIVLARLELEEESILANEAALAILRPTTAPSECMLAARALASQLSGRNEWDRAVEAWRDAVEAAEISFHGWLDDDARQRQISEAGELARWAAFSLAQVGEDVEAAIVIENARTREIRRRIGLARADADRLDALPPELREAFISASAALSTSALGTVGDIGRDLQEVIAQIRAVPGMEDFATGFDVQHLVSAVESDWPVLYVNPTPWGTLLLKLSAGEGGIEVESLTLERPTSLEILGRLIAGDAIEGHQTKSTTPGSFLVAAGAMGTASLQAGLEQLLPWLGEAVAKPIAELLRESRATGVTLIPCGPIGAAPIHASSWSDGSGERCLLDDFAVRYAPSALLASVANSRATEREGRQPSLLALANPGQNLPATEPEVAEIVRHFAGRVRVASGAAATSDFLRDNLPGTTHLHLACHGSAGHFDTVETGIALADGFIPAPELSALSGCTTRVAVVSACQSAVPKIFETPNEVFATSTLLLAAGSACCIAALWPVHDLPTAMLMTRLYEEMFAGGTPPEALRRAQLWLRDLSDNDRDAFLEAHSELQAEYRRRATVADLPSRRGATPDCEPGPFSHPDYWAPFVAVGA